MRIATAISEAYEKMWGVYLRPVLDRMIRTSSRLLTGKLCPLHKMKALGYVMLTRKESFVRAAIKSGQGGNNFQRPSVYKVLKACV